MEDRNHNYHKLDAMMSPPVGGALNNVLIGRLAHELRFHA